MQMNESNSNVEAWTFAAEYLAHQSDLARLVGSKELLEVLETAEGRAWDERDRASGEQ
jgi:hypothetical protein